MLSTALSPCRGVNSRSRDGSSLLGPLGQPVQVEPVVFLGVKAYGAVAATLNEVPGDPGEAEPRVPEHSEDLTSSRHQHEHPTKETVVCPLLFPIISKMCIAA
jgi:hypothetical protein